jgi:hypothetical protein
MKSVEFKLRTPRGTFNIHTLFDNDSEAREFGWGLWFTDDEYDIYSCDNRVGAVVERKY